MIYGVEQLRTADRRVFLRTDYNVPLGEAGQIEDDTRIRASLPTLQHLLQTGAHIIIGSHLGRPCGRVDRRFSLLPVAEHLSDLLGHEVIFPEKCIGDGVKKLSRDLKAGQVMLLENLRFDPGEEENLESFAKQLADLAEVYVNDAFGMLHRAHASTVGMLPYFEERGIGFLVQEELKVLSKLTNAPERPFWAIIGGAKVSDKIGLIERLVDKVDGLILGGGLAYTFLKAQGHAIGRSLVDDDKLHVARRILERASRKGIDVILPSDHLVADEIDRGAGSVLVSAVEVPASKIALDIGPKTIASCAEALTAAKTIFWNGPLGYFENPHFATGTRKIAEIVARSSAVSVIGGGDSVAALRSIGLEKEVTHISTGGGVSLAYLEGRELPALRALEIVE